MEIFSVKTVKMAESRQKMVEFLLFAIKVMFCYYFGKYIE